MYRGKLPQCSVVLCLIVLYLLAGGFTAILVFGLSAYRVTILYTIPCIEILEMFKRFTTTYYPGANRFQLPFTLVLVMCALSTHMIQCLYCSPDWLHFGNDCRDLLFTVDWNPVLRDTSLADEEDSAASGMYGQPLSLIAC